MADMTEDRRPPSYTRAERLADMAVHVTGVTLAMLAAPVLITLAAVWHGDAPTMVAVSIYAVSMLAMFAASACYHMVPVPEWKDVLRRLDHAAIFVKIAGTYTPFAVLIGGVEPAWILGGIWVAAVIGTAVKVAAPRRFEWLTLGLYLAMGWAAIAIGGPLIEGLDAATLVLMAVGGGLYTLGVVFHVWSGLPFQNVIWHVLVLSATFVFYAAVLFEVWHQYRG